MSGDATLFAHRGTNPYVDNSIEAYRWGFNYGADYAETDFRLTKDGVLVSYHDDLPSGIANMTYEEVLARVPTVVTLDELIVLTKEMEAETGRKLGILIETKSADYATHEAAIKTLLAHDFADPERIIIQSFGSELPDVRNTLFPQYGVELPLVQLTGGSLTPALIAHYATYADGVAPVMSLLTAELVASAQAAGLMVNGWTVDGTLADIQWGLNLGLDGIIVDSMQWARPALEKLLNEANVVYGTEQRDVVNGTDGNDKIYAMQGDDIVRGGDGDDVIYGDGGNDLLFGGAGNDRLIGGAGDDYLAGGEGTDVLNGGSGNDVIVASGDQVIFRVGDGIDLLSLDSTSTIHFDGIVPANAAIIRDGNNLIIRAGSDALILLNGVDPAHQPASITTANGLTLTGAELAALAVPGSDAEIAALLPELEARLSSAPDFAEPSTVPVGTDLVTEGDFADGVLAHQFDDAESGAIYRLSFSLADLPTGDDGVRVLWNGQVIYEGIPAETATDLRFIINGGTGDGSNKLVFEGAGASFGASIDNVHLVKLSDPVPPAPGNVAPEAPDADIVVSPGIPYTGQAAVTDADADPLTYSLGESPNHGTLVFKEDGAYRYTPAPGFSGADSFTFLVNDGHGNIVESTVRITVAQSVPLGTDLIVNGSFEAISIDSFDETSGELNPAWWGYYSNSGVIAGWTDLNGNRAEIVNSGEGHNNVEAKDGDFFFDLDGYGAHSEIGQVIAGVEQGARYELKFSIADGDARTTDDGMQVLWGGEVVYEGTPSSSDWATIALELVGGAGDGSNMLVFKGTGAANWFGVALDDVHLVKIADEGDPAAENQAPEAVNGTGEGASNGVITGQLTATDADSDGLIFSLDEEPAHGTVRIFTDGSYEYTPAVGFIGEDSFTFLVSDGRGGTDTATVNLIIAPADVPIGTDLIVNGSFEDVSQSTDSNGPSDWGYRNLDGAIVGWTNVNHGIEQHWDNYGGITAKDGRFWIDMDSSNLGSRHRIGQDVANVEAGAVYRVSFSLSDSDNVRDDDGVRVLWNGEEIFNGLPPQTSDSWTTYEFEVIGGSGDGSNRLEFIDTGAPDSWGAGVALDDVHFVKIANEGDAVAENQAPDAADGNVEGQVNTVITGQLAATDADSDDLIFSLGEGPAHGTIRVYTDGTYKYTPAAGFIGEDSFTFQVDDGRGGTDTATVNLTVSPAVPVHVPIGTDLIVNGSFEDVSGSSDNNGPSDWGYRNLDGTIVGWTNVNNNRIEQHWDNYGGVVAKDGRFWIDMDSSNMPDRHRIGQNIANVETGATYRVSFSLSDSDNVRDDDGVRVLWNGEVIFEGIPPQTSASWTTYEFDVIGGSGDGSNRLEFIDIGEPDSWGAGAALDDVHFVKVADVPEANTAPVAVDDSGFETAYGAALTIDPATLLANDSDADADMLTILSVTAGTGGTVTLDDDGNVIFTPAEGFVGEASFSYVVSDGKGGTATANVTIVVAPQPGSGTIEGTPGDDELVGTSGDDVILAGEGDDLVLAGAGNDVVEGGDGDDELHGEAGDDVLSGGEGDDTLYGGDGDDVLKGGAGDDLLDGGDGIDTADYSDDTAGVKVDLSAGEAYGDDSGEDELVSIENVIGGSGDDELIGDDEDNRLIGGAGNDILRGGAGNDVLDGGDGDDLIEGGAGDDLIIASLGDDVIDGGEGFDTLDLSAATGPVRVDFGAGMVSGDGIGTNHFTSIEKLLFGAGDDVVTGGNGDDAFDGGAGNDTLKGGAGDDTLWGGEGDDLLDGGSGDDVLHGGTGDDRLKGGSGDDTLWGGDGDDILDGGSGDDLLYGGEGNDVIDGGSGADRIEGGAGDDVLTGGSGHDTFVFAAGFGNDTITDFRTSGSSSDILEFATDLFADFDAAMATASQVGADVVFTIDADTSLTLEDVRLACLSQDDFRFV